MNQAVWMIVALVVAVPVGVFVEAPLLRRLFRWIDRRRGFYMPDCFYGLAGGVK